MGVNAIKDISDTAKSISEFSTGFWEFIEHIVPGITLGRTIAEGHSKLIDSVVMNDEIDVNSRMMFLAMYKKRLKEIERCSKVTEVAIDMIDKKVDPSKVDEDWYEFFFERVKNISDSKVQYMWAQILAGELNSPNSFSKMLIHILSIMSKEQAEFFCNLSRFCMKEYRGKNKTKHVHAFVYIGSSPGAYESSGISYEKLKDMENMGLIRCSFEREYIFKNKQYVSYGNKYIEIRGNEDNENKIMVGNVCLTENGESLYEIVGEEFKSYSSQILNFTISELERRGCHVYVNEQKKTK